MPQIPEKIVTSYGDGKTSGDYYSREAKTINYLIDYLQADKKLRDEQFETVTQSHCDELVRKLEKRRKALKVQTGVGVPNSLEVEKARNEIIDMVIDQALTIVKEVYQVKE